MNNLLDYKIIILLVIILGFAPFLPQPHIVEKIMMLAGGTLKRPVDIFDLVWHSWPIALLVFRIYKDIRHQAD